MKFDRFVAPILAGRILIPAVLCLLLVTACGTGDPVTKAPPAGTGAMVTAGTTSTSTARSTKPAATPTTSTDATLTIKANQEACSAFESEMIRNRLGGALEQFRVDNTVTGPLLLTTIDFRAPTIPPGTERAVGTAIGNVAASVPTLRGTITYEKIDSVATSYETAKTACASFHTPTPVRFEFTCAGYPPYSSYQAALAAESNKCEVKRVGGNEYSEQQTNAVALATEAGRLMDSLETLYSLCSHANGRITDTHSVSGVQLRDLSSSDIAEARAVLMLCPDHPQAAAIQADISAAETRAGASVASAASASPLAAVERQALTDGSLVHPGKYLVRRDIQPGTWQSLGSKVTNCYWEISDFQGEIMDYNFFSVAPQFTINIPADAAGFTATGCSFQRIGD